MKDDRGPWYLLTGLLIGIVLGLAFAWIVQPVQYIDTSPASLRTQFKDQYRALIALAYTADGDIVRARARLELLKDQDIFSALAGQAQRTLGEGRSPAEARALGLLAVALGQAVPGPAVVITLPPPTITLTPTETNSPTPSPTNTETPLPSETPTATVTIPLPAQATGSPTPTFTLTASPTIVTQGTPTKTQIPRPTFTPTLTPTPTSTPGGPFMLASRQKICTQELQVPLIQIEASNTFGQPVPGVLVLVTWSSGEMRFYTGLKPELSLGYADFTPVPGIVYSLRLGENGEVVEDLAAVSCTGSAGNTFWGAWLLEFVQ
jgi:hypothetical protein